MARVPAFQAGHAGSIPVTRSTVTHPDLDLVLPLVRPQFDADDGEPPIADVLVASLVVVYAFDRDDRFHLLARADLDRLGVDQAHVATAARDNLLDRLDDLEILERPDGCGMVRLDGNLDASVLLVPELWADIEKILGKVVLVAVPARDVVLFCGAGGTSEKRALEAARDRALAVGNRRITADLLRFSAGSWLVEPT
jgi:uncharacterized protein YtpQ (UPF0354 family)